MPKTNSTIFPHALLLGCNATPSLVGRTLCALADGAVIPAAGRTTLAAASPSSRPSSSRDTSSAAASFTPTMRRPPPPPPPPRAVRRVATRAEHPPRPRTARGANWRRRRPRGGGYRRRVGVLGGRRRGDLGANPNTVTHREDAAEGDAATRSAGEVGVISGWLGAFAARASIGPGGSHVARRGVVGGGGWAQAGGSITARRGRVGRHATAEDPLSPPPRRGARRGCRRGRLRRRIRARCRPG